MAFLFAPLTSAFGQRQLLRELSRREVQATFQGSMLGAGWLVLQPLASLTVYALVFGGILNLHGAGGGLAFVSQLFAGMIVYQAFAEFASEAPHLVRSRPNFVTKVAFPLHLLPWPTLTLAALHAGVSTVLLLGLHLCFVGPPAWTALLLPLAIAPVLLLGLGVSWVLSALAVYVPDTAEVARIALQMLFFLSPVVWSVADVPDETVRTIVLLNPLAIAMETFRSLLGGTGGPGVVWIAGFCMTSWLVAAGGHAFFSRVQDGFADVL